MKIVKDIQKQQTTSKISDKEAEEAIKTILEWMGEDPNREGLLETPKRVIKAFKEYFKGYSQDPNLVLEKTFGDVEGYSDMVVQKNISIQSHCEHHMAPIIGVAHVAYLPSRRVIGISKLARIVDIYARRLQIQEKLTVQIADTIDEVLITGTLGGGGVDGFSMEGLERSALWHELCVASSSSSRPPPLPP